MIVAGICLKEEEGELRVLLVKSSAGRTIFPKGHTEPGEPPWYAAGREAGEEAGWATQPLQEPLGTYKSDKNETVTAFLLAQPERCARPPEPGREPEWVPVLEARRRLMADHGSLLGLGMCVMLNLAERRYQEQCA